MNSDDRAEVKAWSIIALIVIAVGFAAFFLFVPATQWLTSDAAGTHVDVAIATGGMSSFDGHDQQYRDGFGDTIFEHEGAYDGIPFSGDYTVGGKTLLRFTPDLVPGDGVPDVFMFAIRQNQSIVIRVLVDEDYKAAFGNVNIVWGAQYQHQRVFGYRPASKGIYTDEVPDDPARRVDGDNNIYGGVALGQITTTDFQRGNTDVTAIILH